MSTPSKPVSAKIFGHKKFFVSQETLAVDIFGFIDAYATHVIKEIFTTNMSPFVYLLPYPLAREYWQRHHHENLPVEFEPATPADPNPPTQRPLVKLPKLDEKDPISLAAYNQAEADNVRILQQHADDMLAHESACEQAAAERYQQTFSRVSLARMPTVTTGMTANDVAVVKDNQHQWSLMKEVVDSYREGLLAPGVLPLGLVTILEEEGTPLSSLLPSQIIHALSTLVSPDEASFDTIQALEAIISAAPEPPITDVLTAGVWTATVASTQRKFPSHAPLNNTRLFGLTDDIITGHPVLRSLYDQYRMHVVPNSVLRSWPSWSAHVRKHYTNHATIVKSDTPARANAAAGSTVTATKADAHADFCFVCGQDHNPHRCKAVASITAKDQRLGGILAGAKKPGVRITMRGGPLKGAVFTQGCGHRAILNQLAAAVAKANASVANAADAKPADVEKDD